MTDLETMRAMLTNAGVVFTEHPSVDAVEPARPGEMNITIEAYAGPRNKGYSGFAAVLTFDPDGALCQVGVWE